MRVLFLHRAFPAQFGRLALELTTRYGWQCSFLVEHLSRCPTPSPEMLQRLTLLTLPRPAAPADKTAIPWPQQYGSTLQAAQAVHDAVRAHPQLRPDLVVAHGGLTPTLLLRGLLDCPLVDYCEYYFAPQHRDLTYRVDLPAVEPAAFFPRCINAATLLNLADCDAGYAPTLWQQRSFPRRFWSKIAVHFDGIDTQLYRPRTLPRFINGAAVAESTRIVTFVARGLESMRGFDLFLRLAQRIQQEMTDVLFVVAGDETVYYGWDGLRTGDLTFKQWAVRQTGCDLTRFVFLNHIEPAALAEVFALSDLHVYLSVPFVVSWSLFDALATGCVVLAGDVEPVRELIRSGENGLLEPLFDSDRLAATALRVLRDPAAFRPLGQAARQMIEERYSLEVSIPALRDYFERVAARAPVRDNRTT
ncbi:MAG: glycosyltransferase [Planctomycetia bacterium]|nr:glycosyltransferase [Planctomycetia bacterium]